MNVEQLIEYITAEVIKRVQLVQDSQEVYAKNIEEVKEKVVVIGEEKELQDQYQRNLEDQYDVTLTSSYDVVHQYSCIILTSTDIDLLASINIGLLGEKYKIIQDAIMRGKPIYVAEEGILYKKYKYTCNQNFYALLLSYEEKARSFGIEFISENEIIERLNKGKRLSKHCVDTTYCKLITEQILKEELSRGNLEMKVASNALITPLAADYARQHNMTIIRM